MAKQVIVVRKDLNMTKGKMIAQGAHASLAVILRMMRNGEGHVDHSPDINNGYYNLVLRVKEGSELDDWLRGIFKKICVSVSSEEELLSIYEKAKSRGLPVELIQDSGLTMFGGVPTYTCLAIGPATEEDIDLITGSLKLF